MAGIYERGVRECRCGMEIDADVTAMMAHVLSDEHVQRIAAMGLELPPESDEHYPERPESN